LKKTLQDYKEIKEEQKKSAHPSDSEQAKQSAKSMRKNI
jgi:hypothetical protein